jgi:HK97 family phage portal protein
MSAFTWRELWSINTSLWGNHYSAIRYNAAGRVTGFESALPWQVEVVRIIRGPMTGQNGYVFTWPDGSREPIAQEDVLHIPGIGFDGMKGYSRIRHFARNSVSLAKLYEEQSGRMHENGARPSVAVEMPSKVSPEGFRRMRAFFEESNVGRMNAGKPLYLDPGAKVTPFQINPDDMQTLESRKFQIEEICRFWGVPPVMVGGAQATTWGTGIEQIVLGFKVFTLEAELQRIEAELRQKLFTGTSEYPRFDRDALVALDVVAEAQAAAAEIGSGALLINERRRFKHRPAVHGGDEPLVNSTMIPLSRVLGRSGDPPGSVQR